MLRKFRVCLLLLSLTLIMTSVTTAQSTVPDAGREQKIKAKVIKRGVGKNARTKVRLLSDVVYKGYISAANDKEFVVIDKFGAFHHIEYRDVRSVDEPGLSGGAKLAIGILIGAGAVLGILAAVIAAND